MNAFDLVKQNVKIEDYAAHLGMTVVRRGNTLTTKEHDSIVIRPEKNMYYRNSTQRGGSIIDFVMEFTDHDTPSKAVAHLLEFGNLTEQEKKLRSPGRKTQPARTEKKEKTAGEIVLPEHASDNRRVYAYLSKTRGISAEIISYMIKHNYLYQDTRNNCVFVGYDSEGSRSYGMLRSTYSEGTFKGDLRNCDYEKCMLVDTGADTLVVTEAAIDAMSYMDIIKQAGGNFRDNSYLILGSSTKWKALEYRLSRHEYTKVILALDNDAAGRLGNEKMAAFLKELGFGGDIVTDIPKNNDWNDDLRELKDLSSVKPLAKARLSSDLVVNDVVKFGDQIYRVKEQTSDSVTLQGTDIPQFVRTFSNEEIDAMIRLFQEDKPDTILKVFTDISPCDGDSYRASVTVGDITISNFIITRTGDGYEVSAPKSFDESLFEIKNDRFLPTVTELLNTECRKLQAGVATRQTMHTVAI